MSGKATASVPPGGDADGQDPTMEEILASIRRIISDDDDDDATPAPAPLAAVPPAGNEDDDDVLELTQLVAVPQEETASALDDDLTMEMTAPVAAEALPEPEPVAAQPEAKAPVLSKEELVSTATASAAATAMAELTRSLASRHMALGTGITLEDIVREMLRPMLKDWLDQHLAGIIERVVQQEIERLAKQALGG